MIYRTTKGAASIARILRQKSLDNFSWQLRWKPVCASTEKELTKWLNEKPCLINSSRAIIADRQNHGIGQRGRHWHAPSGGVWISAALPYKKTTQSIELFGLAIAFTLSQRLEKMNVPVQIKWPNDLMVFEKKLVGFLPRFIYRGQFLRLIRIGIGMNVRNKVPKEGIALNNLLDPNECLLSNWTVEVLCAINKAQEVILNKEFLIAEVEKRLWSNKVIDPVSKDTWNIEGLAIDGALRLEREGKKVVWTRWS